MLDVIKFFIWFAFWGYVVPAVVVVVGLVIFGLLFGKDGLLL